MLAALDITASKPILNMFMEANVNFQAECDAMSSAKVVAPAAMATAAAPAAAAEEKKAEVAEDEETEEMESFDADF